MNRPRLFIRTFSCVGAACVALSVLGCGPRLKPVEYEEPPTTGSDSGDSEVTGSDSSEGSSSSSSSSEGGDGDTTSGGDVASGYSPCKEKKCGEACTLCAPGDFDCSEIAIQKQCNGKAECVPAPATCGGGKKKTDSKKDSAK